MHPLLRQRRPLTELEETALRIMSTRPAGWPSGELIEAILNAEPLFGDSRTVRRAFTVLRDRDLALPEGVSKGRIWKATRTGKSVRPSLDHSIALLTLRQVAHRHLPASVIGSLQADFEAAARVLNEHPNAPSLAEAREWMGKTARLNAGYPVIPPTIDETVMETVWRALYKDESLDITYKRSEISTDNVKKYRVLPYAIVEKGPLWYLVVRNKRRSDEGTPLQLRLDRILAAAPVGIDLVRDKKFSLASYITEDRNHEFFAEEPVQIVLRVSEKEHEHAFRSMRLSEDQTIVEAKGGFLLTATICPSVALTNLLLEKAPSVEVVAPPSLRQGLIERLRLALSHYERDS